MTATNPLRPAVKIPLVDLARIARYDPLVPVIVTELVPAGAVIVRTVDPEPLTVGLENVYVVPFGKPVTLNVKVPVKPPVDPTVTVYLAAAPGATSCERGETVIEKSPGQNE